MTAKVAPAIRVELPGGAVLARAKGQGQAPVRCERCGSTSNPDPVRDLAQFEAWAKKHHGEVCQP